MPLSTSLGDSACVCRASASETFGNAPRACRPSTPFSLNFYRQSFEPLGWTKEEQAARVDQLEGTFRWLRRHDLEGRQHRGNGCSVPPTIAPADRDIKKSTGTTWDKVCCEVVVA